MKCRWTIVCNRPQDNAFGSHLKFSFSRLELEANGNGDCFDYVAIYSGTSPAPGNMVSRLCGNMRNPVCVSGFLTCISIFDIVVPGLEATVEFSSDSGSYFDGFALNWEVVPVSVTSKRQASPATFPQFISFFSGGAVSLFNTDITILLSSFLLNSAFDTFFGVGAALLSRGGTVAVRNSTFLRNTVMGIIAAGGAAAVFGGAGDSRFDLKFCRFEQNGATATGFWCVSFLFWCLFYFLTTHSTAGTSSTSVQCPASFGGAIVQGGSTVTEIGDTQFEENIATCFTQLAFCTASGGSLAIVGDNNFFSSNMRCTKSMVECSTEKKCQFGDGGCIFADAGRLFFWNSTLENNSVSGVGGGGAVALDGTSFLAMQSCEIRSNTASQGGAFISKGKSTLKILFSNVQGNNGFVTAGAVAAYEEGNLIISACFFVNNSAARVPGIFGFAFGS